MKVSEVALGLIIGAAVSAAILWSLVRLVMTPILWAMVSAQ